MKYSGNIKKLFVVGNKFREFSDGKDVVTIDDLDLITQIPARIIGSNTKFIVGQGVSGDHAKKIIDKYNDNELSQARIDISSLANLTTDNMRNAYTHKRKSFNSLIGKAKKIADNQFQLPLIIDERCELMGDHQTGQHIQGMLLVEAFRQTFVAVTEEFLLSDNPDKKSFVIRSMDISFENFMFPLNAHIVFNLKAIDINERRAKFSARIEAWQYDKLCAFMDTDYTTYPAEVISELEGVLAKEITDSATNIAEIGLDGTDEDETDRELQDVKYAQIA